MTKPAFRNILDILFWVVLGGLIVWGYQAATAKKIEKSSTATAESAQRKANVKALIAAGPKTKVWETPEGRVIQLSIPSAILGGQMVEVKKCIVWSGASALAVAMSCEPDVVEPFYNESEGSDIPYSF